MISELFKKTLDQTYERVVNNVKARPRDLAWRKQQLLALKAMLTENEEAIDAALWQDYHKGPFEASATEQGIVISEIDFALSHIDSWMKPEHVHTPLYNQIGSSQIIREAYGVVLVIGAWNYPINLLLAPVVGAICGGNGVIMKPSEISSNTGKLVAELVEKYLDSNLIAAIQGGADETDLLLDKKFDLIFFTGSIPVGKIVMQKAAANLTPVVLELGGKSPAIVLEDADLKVSARRIVWGKFMNAGQTCVAPDYILIQPAIKAKFVQELRDTLLEFYGVAVKDNKDYCRIINEKNFDRLIGLLEGSKVLHGGQSDKSSLYIEPTLLESTGDSKAMTQEIFGPLLPIIEVADVNEAISFVNKREKPLALYLFSQNENHIDEVLGKTSSGGVSVNDVIMHMAAPTLPFGGVGSSGTGHYHGKYSFDTFTHAKAVYKKSTLVDIPLRYPPYTETKQKWMKRFFK